MLLSISLTACGGAPPAPRESPRKVADPKPQLASSEKARFEVVELVNGLEHPWALAFLPGGRFLVTERPGRLRVAAADGRIGNPVTGVPAVAAWGAATKSMFRKPAVTTAGP